MHQQNFTIVLFSCLILSVSSCKTTKQAQAPFSEQNTSLADLEIINGGSSGMEQVSDSSFIVVYDRKRYSAKDRIGLITLSKETLTVSPIKINSWGPLGISNDLESICAVPGHDNQYLISEAGDWQGTKGRIFHIMVNLGSLTATILSILELPFQSSNDLQVTGDQYEAIHCLPHTPNERIIILGERGGSKINPKGILRWGVWDIQENTLTIEDKGLQGLPVDAPGNWSDKLSKRSITDFHVHLQGTIWASASEDQGDEGPFYSVIYKLGQINHKDHKNPIIVKSNFIVGKEIYGFKIEALSGPKKGVNCTHTIGTEDEMYGGVWRPVKIN